MTTNTVMITITTMSTIAEQIRDFRFGNLTGRHALESAYGILNSTVARYPQLDDESAIQLEALAVARDAFYLYFSVHPEVARAVVDDHHNRFGGLRGVLWPALSYLFGNALYRWKYMAARRATKATAVG